MEFVGMPPMPPGMMPGMMPPGTSIQLPTPHTHSAQLTNYHRNAAHARWFPTHARRPRSSPWLSTARVPTARYADGLPAWPGWLASAT